MPLWNDFQKIILNEKSKREKIVKYTHIYQ